MRSLHGTYQDKTFTAHAKQGYIAKQSIRAFQNGLFEDLSKAEYSSAIGCLPTCSIPEKAWDSRVLVLASLAGEAFLFSMRPSRTACASSATSQQEPGAMAWFRVSSLAQMCFL